MLDRNKILKLFSDFLHSILNGAFYRVILIQDNYFCIPKELTNEKIILQKQEDSPYYLISHQTPVRRDTIKEKIKEQFQTEHFIIVYNTAEPLSGQFLDELKHESLNCDLTPINLINYWLEESANLDDSLNFLSLFIWDSKDFIIKNRAKILIIKSLNNDIRFNRIVEILLKNTFTSLIEKGKIISLMNDKNSWKLWLIFNKNNYIYKKLFNVFKEEIELDDGLINYLKNLILNRIGFEEFLKITIVAHFLAKLGPNLITSINFNSFIDNFSEINDPYLKDSIKNLNRLQIRTFSEIFENYLKNLLKTKSMDDLHVIFSLIRKLGDIILNNDNLKEITIENRSLQGSNEIEQCLKLSKLNYFYYLPLKISEVFFTFFTHRIHELNRPLVIDDGGRIRKIADNIKSGDLLKFFNGLEDNYQKIINFYDYFYKLSYGLFAIARFNKAGFINWDFRKWVRFYTDFYIKFIENLDAISKIYIQYNYYTQKCREIIKWITTKFNELEFEISKKFFNFIKSKYPVWVTNFRNPRVCPLLTANVFERFISKTFSRPLNNNFIILNDGCTLDNWKVLKRCIRNDFKDFELEDKIGFSIIPSKTFWSRRAIFNGDLMRQNRYFRGESLAFLDLLKRVKGFRKSPGDHNKFFNTKCETNAKFEMVEKNIEAGEDLTQIIIFNFSDVLNEASIERVDVKDIIENTYYPKIKKLLNLILMKYPNPNLFFVTDHGITETKTQIQHLYLLDNHGHRVYSLKNSIPREICERSPRLLQLHPDYTLDLSSIPIDEMKKILVINDLSEFGLIGKEYNKMVVASSHYTFTSKGKAHGGVTLEEMIIPFSRMLKKPIISKTDFEQPKILIENKEEYETTSNYLKLLISNENSEDFSNLKLHFITKNTHQVRHLLNLRANSRKKIKIYCDDKGIEPIKVELNYYFRYNKFTYEFEFKLSLEDFNEDLESNLDDLIDEEF